MIGTLKIKLWRDLLSLRGHAITTGGLVACGIGLFVSMWSAYRSLSDARTRTYDAYRFAEIFATLKRAPVSLVRRAERISGVERVESGILIDGLITRIRDEPETEPASGRFLSVPSGDQPLLNRLHVREGRLPVTGSETEILVHEGFARAHNLHPGDLLTLLVQGTQEVARVSGIAISPEFIVAVSPATPLPDDNRFGVFWLPLPALERISRMKDSFNHLYLTLSNPKRPQEVMQELDEILAPYGGRGSYTRDRQESDIFVQDEIRQQRASALLSPAVFLSIAAFLVQVTISRIVAIHRPQIAILKAFGFPDRRIALHYLGLVCLLMTGGALAGVGLGHALGRLMARSYEGYFRFPSIDFSLSGQSILIGLFAGILPGVMGAWGSVRSIARLPPAEAMRAPTGPVYAKARHGLGERRTHLGIRNRMVLRNLGLKPLRLIQILIGLSASTAVVVTSLAWVDILDFMLEMQFERIQREDLSIGLIDPVPKSGLRDLEVIPGIIEVEGYRVVPVRLHWRGSARTLLLTGFPKNPRLRKSIDSRLIESPIPESGILLSQFFHKTWGIPAGDTVELEILEGRPRTITLQVSGFSGELMGLNASARLETLWSALGEEPSYTTAALRIDRSESPAIYRRLVQSAKVGFVQLKSAMYAGFQATMGGMILIMSAILIAFALVISLGILFTSVRTSFSERARELASLRVLGFSPAWVIQLLSSEVCLQVALSLAPGCALGWGITQMILRGVHTETFSFPIFIHSRTYALGILASTTGLLIGLVSIRRSVRRLDMVQTLKSRD